MKRLMIATLSVLVLSAVLAPVASAGRANTTTCPSEGSVCTGSGGAAGR
jgi:hypothetical protein